MSEKYGPEVSEIDKHPVKHSERTQPDRRGELHNRYNETKAVYHAPRSSSYDTLITQCCAQNLLVRSVLKRPGGRRVRASCLNLPAIEDPMVIVGGLQGRASRY